MDSMESIDGNQRSHCLFLIEQLDNRLFEFVQFDFFPYFNLRGGSHIGFAVQMQIICSMETKVTNTDKRVLLQCGSRCKVVQR